MVVFPTPKVPLSQTITVETLPAVQSALDLAGDRRRETRLADRWGVVERTRGAVHRSVATTTESQELQARVSALALVRAGMPCAPY